MTEYVAILSLLQSFPLAAEFDWRTEYKLEVGLVGAGLVVTSTRPWYGELGLFNHFSHKAPSPNISYIESEKQSTTLYMQSVKAMKCLITNSFATCMLPAAPQSDGLTLRLVPRFMFGLPQSVLDRLYGGPASIPTIGMLTASPGRDRVIVQCFMNLVILSVIFLLWANNPVSPKANKDQ